MSNSKTQRNTRQRNLILEELQKLKSHPTAATLYTIVRRRMPKISLGTVYRNLELLSRAGTINKLEFSGSEARYDGTVKYHDHMRCVECGRIDDAASPPRAIETDEQKDFAGYKVLGHRLEYIGICPKCLNRRKNEKEI